MQELNQKNRVSIHWNTIKKYFDGDCRVKIQLYGWTYSGKIIELYPHSFLLKDQQGEYVEIFHKHIQCIVNIDGNSKIYDGAGGRR